MRRRRVILADDDVLLREALASLLEQHGFDVVGRAGTSSQLLELVGENEPDLVVVDIRMPPNHTTEGLDAAHSIREASPDIGISCSPLTWRSTTPSNCYAPAGRPGTCSSTA